MLDTTSLVASRLSDSGPRCAIHWTDAAGTVVSHIDTSCLSFSGPLQCRSQLQRYWASSHVGDVWYGLTVCTRKVAFSWPVLRLSLSWPFDQPVSWDDTEPGPSDGCARICLPLSCVLGSFTSQIDISLQQSCSQLYRTGLGSAVYPRPLVSWHGREAPRRRTEAAWKCSATHHGIQALQVGEWRLALGLSTTKSPRLTPPLRAETAYHWRNNTSHNQMSGAGG